MKKDSKMTYDSVLADEVNSFSLRRFIIRLLPIFIAEWLAPVIASKDSVGTGNYYRLYDAKKPLSGAGILIRYE